MKRNANNPVNRYQRKARLNCTLEIPASAISEREEIEIPLNRLQRASVSVLYAGQERGTVHVLERWVPTAAGYRAVFTPGIIDALGEGLAPLAKLRRLTEVSY